MGRIENQNKIIAKLKKRIDDQLERYHEKYNHAYMETVTIDSTDKMDETRKLLIRQDGMEDKQNFLRNMTG